MAEHLKSSSKKTKKKKSKASNKGRKSAGFLSRLLGTGMARDAAKAAKKRNKRLQDL